MDVDRFGGGGGRVCFGRVSHRRNVFAKWFRRGRSWLSVLLKIVYQLGLKCVAEYPHLVYVPRISFPSFQEFSLKSDFVSLEPLFLLMYITNFGYFDVFGPPLLDFHS